MKEILRLVGVLTAICLICTALLATVYRKTEGPIEAAGVLRAARAAQEVMPPGATEPERVELPGPDGGAPLVFFVARRDGMVHAVALEGRSTRGYSGDVVLMVGLSEGKLTNFKVIKQNETPGLGNKIARDAFRLPMLGRDVAGTKWMVKKDGGDIDAITAATISSRAALEAIRDAIARHDAHRDQLK